MAEMNRGRRGSLSGLAADDEVLLRAAGTAAAAAEEFELSPVQCHVLHLIEPERPLPMGRLAATLGCDASNVTGLVDRLEARGLVQRRPSADDRRIKVIQLTATGSRIRAHLLKRMTGKSSCSMARLSPDDQRSLIRILERLIDQNS